MIKRRNVVMIVVLFIITLTIYGLYWFYTTADETIRYNKSDANPLVWLILALLPFLNIIGIWLHSQEIARLSASGNGRGINGILLFILWFVPIPFLVGMVISQLVLNKKAGEAAA